MTRAALRAAHAEALAGKYWFRGLVFVAGVTTMHTRDAVDIGAPRTAATGTGLSRREFLAAGGLGAAWALLSGPWLAAIGAAAHEAAARGAAFGNLTQAQGRALAAVVDRIIPAVDGLPGATAAGAVHFADFALEGPASGLKDMLVAGLDKLDGSARALQPGSTGFAELPPTAQDKLLRAIDKSPFFHAASMLAIFGTFSAPQYGGNRDGVGWELVQMEQRMRWQPPFGWYDAQWAHEHPEVAS